MTIRPLTIAAVLALIPVASLAETIISVNIGGGNQNAPGTGGGAGEGIVTGNAGLGQLGNWNNAIGTSGTISGAVNSDGVATGVNVTWTTNNTWSSGSADGLGTDADMLSGYLDNFQSNGSIVVEGLGAEFTTTGYDVLVYYQNDNDNNTAGFTATDNLSNADTRYGHQLAAGNNWPLDGGEDGYVVSTETDSSTTFSANVIRLTGLSGPSFTLSGESGTGQPSTRARPNAIQIITEGTAVDSDGDGLPDEWEIENGLDPFDNGDVNPDNGASGDPDGDTVENIDEFGRSTDPQDEDTDDDDLNDAVETNTGVYVSPTDTGTNPLETDTDGDTLGDAEEIDENPFFSNPNLADTDGDSLDDASEEEANPFITNPSLQDTDEDGFNDATEIRAGSDPTDPNSIPDAEPQGPTLSINIAGGNANAPSDGGGAGEGIVTEIAGLGKLGNWQNAIGTSGTITELVDSDGNATEATFSWTTNNTWSTGTADGLGSDTDMMSGYLDNFHANGSIVVEGLDDRFTAEGYDILVYFQNDNAANTGGFNAVDSLENTDMRFGHQLLANNNWPLAGGDDGYIVSEETDPATTFSSNIVKLSGLSGPNFTLTGVAGTGVASTRARPNAIQIIGKAAFGPVLITSIDYDAASNKVTLTWESRPGVTYTVDASEDLPDWPQDIDDSVISQGDSTTFQFDGPGADTKRIFYRVRVSE